MQALCTPYTGPTQALRGPNTGPIHIYICIDAPSDHARPSPTNGLFCLRVCPHHALGRQCGGRYHEYQDDPHGADAVAADEYRAVYRELPTEAEQRRPFVPAPRPSWPVFSASDTYRTAVRLARRNRPYYVSARDAIEAGAIV